MVLTYNYDDQRPEKDWVLKTDHGLDGDSLSYLDMMERNKEEENRRARERIIMEEGRRLYNIKRQEEEQVNARDLEDIKELAKLRMFGRPGHGAPTMDIRKKKFTEHQMDTSLQRSTSMFSLDQAQDYMMPAPVSSTARNLEESSSYLDLDSTDVLKFGRAGCGAPMRTKSGRLRTTITGNPEIRFQNNESVKKTISQNIRYARPRDEKSSYADDLEEQIRTKALMREAERQNDFAISKHLVEVEGSQWGKPGPGGAYWRNSAVTGQGFFDKMGWSGSADPRKREFNIKRGENEHMKREMEEIRGKRHYEHQDMTSEVGIELVPLMKDKHTGNPKKDPSTGYMMSHNLNSTDVTRLADQKGPQPWHSSGNKQKYWEQLTGQVGEKYDIDQRKKLEDEAQQLQHFQSWESYWGKPGYGAPRETTHKENLVKMLHYPPTVANAPNNVELITLERLPVK